MCWHRVRPESYKGELEGQDSRPVVVGNTEQSGRWGAEERTYHMPFQPGVYFEAILHVRNHCYQVSVNGQHFLEYKHRLPLYTVQSLEINGDVTVNCISFTNPSDSRFQPAPAYGFQRCGAWGCYSSRPDTVYCRDVRSRRGGREGGPSRRTSEEQREEAMQPISNVFAQPVFTQPVFGAPGPKLFSRERLPVSIASPPSAIPQCTGQFSVLHDIAQDSVWFRQHRRLEAISGASYFCGRCLSPAHLCFNHSRGLPSLTNNVGAICWGINPSHASGQRLVWKHQLPRIVTNPAIPFQVALPKNAYRKITLVGNVPFYANRFHVNLKHSLTGNIALHINPRLKEQALVRNTQTHGTWGSEERQVSTLPFSPGQAFQMEILSTKNCYQVSVNGLHVFNYLHRIPAHLVDQLEVAGDVTLSSVQY
nr:galectin-4-like [Pelodiscus sinensis]|eukprot:XP_025036712.1 galectin-4-like [Pelodiscus sinensis]